MQNEEEHASAQFGPLCAHTAEASRSAVQFLDLEVPDSNGGGFDESNGS